MAPPAHSRLSDYTNPQAWELLAEAVQPWLRLQRWFAGKARDVEAAAITDAFVLADDGVEVLDLVVEVTYSDSGRERYQLPVVAAAGTDGPPEAVVATLPQQLRLVDASFVPAAAHLLALLALRPDRRTTPSGATLVGHPVGSADTNLGTARRLGGEQSNTSIALGSAIFKLFRKLEEGENPDVEITRALTMSGFRHAPRQRGAAELHTSQGQVIALGVLNDFIAGARDAWQLAVDDVAAASDGRPAEDVRDDWGEVGPRAGALGEAVADLHATLRDTLGTREATPQDRKRWVDVLRRHLDSVLLTARLRRPDACEQVFAERERMLSLLTTVADDDTPVPLMRTHGDLHLGQVLLDADGSWQLLDFEGEPARPLAERKDLHPPLRDVAGMLRSFDYAAAVGSGGDLSAVPEAAARWRDRTQDAFLDAYLATAGKHGVLPPTSESASLLLDAFELDKALYELGYELANRPDWVAIPIGGILRVLNR